MKSYILILVISGGSQTGKTTIQQEFNSLTQCKYVYNVLTNQVNNSYASKVTAGGCFEK